MKSKHAMTSILMLLAAVFVVGMLPTTIQAVNYMDLEKIPVDRTVLPIKEPHQKPITTLYIQGLKKQPPLFKVEAPEDAPNVVIIMLDDLGYGGTGTFGGVVNTPTIDKLVESGIRYTQIHSTAQCASTRIALNTGRNHHSCNTGIVGEMATSIPGYTGKLPADIAPLPKILKLNGYNTAAFGKWHMTEAYNVTPTGPFDNWPNGMGYEYFYGFMGGETNQWYPAIYENLNPVEAPEEPGYHFMYDMTEKAISWVKTQQALSPEKPFYMYFTPGAVHAPHHVPKEYIEKYKGKFDEGWDVIRNRIFEKQKKLGVIPPHTKLAKKAPVVKDWKDLTDQEKMVFARQAEVFAGYLDMADHEIGRLIQTLEDLGAMENTLIFYIAGDNGTSPEGQAFGTFNEYTTINGYTEEFDFLAKHIDEWGGPTTYPHMATGWAVAFDSPFSYFKQVASNYGGTRQGTVVHWPIKIKAKGELRNQWHHVIDIAPTILEAAGIPEPGFLTENGFINTKNTSWEAIAEIESKGAKTNGVLVQQGGAFGGWSFYVKEGTPVFHYNWFGIEQYKVIGTSKLPSGKCTVKMDFAYEGGDKLGLGGTVTLYINDKKVGSGKVDKTEPTIFSADETSNVGIDRESMVSKDYTQETSRFNGKIAKVTINLK